MTLETGTSFMPTHSRTKPFGLVCLAAVTHKVLLELGEPRLIHERYTICLMTRLRTSINCSGCRDQFVVRLRRYRLVAVVLVLCALYAVSFFASRRTFSITTLDGDGRFASLRCHCFSANAVTHRALFVFYYPFHQWILRGYTLAEHPLPSDIIALSRINASAYVTSIHDWEDEVRAMTGD